ncbi:hypothetical protein HBI56_135710 [Parastagonospora nodorum]|uniref:Uncharacterized protein n=1 Tax=Phaeosphaeria nodorum (strain SN15 / ATCC MYA-4574 / FGSC 10173) TaxID=321614 RepID=A0A7U2FBD6_PHANO|nr:hypothetical protein HBH56_038800 [Parastagonospora nodorum]QRC99830.1 hypothetical protein JI435_414110 [Parastagonospora nodorum SN15]KAH3933571.1 hypothetical protein HBH54_060660 [Parastagonospora nodorum]KAH3941030.1 hypothetical protein HBH53_207620 [Parastagonospora nodorum]KAH3957976.1 hypothetical protein HBH51_215310 [Parastagonospora nodorum]
MEINNSVNIHRIVLRATGVQVWPCWITSYCAPARQISKAMAFRIRVLAKAVMIKSSFRWQIHDTWMSASE